MTILDWFDVDNIEHLVAYKYLQDTGTWPKGFIPEDNEYVSLQTITLANRLADRYVEEKLSGDTKLDTICCYPERRRNIGCRTCDYRAICKVRRKENKNAIRTK